MKSIRVCSKSHPENTVGTPRMIYEMDHKINKIFSMCFTSKKLGDKAEY